MEHKNKMIWARIKEIEQVQKWADENELSFSRYLLECAYKVNKVKFDRD